MKIALVILPVIGVGLYIYSYYTTRYYNDLFGDKSILISRHLITLNKRFSVVRFMKYFSQLIFLSVGTLLLYHSFSILISDFWAALMLLVLSISLIFTSFVLFSLEKNLKKLTSYQYIFDPKEKSLEIIGIKKIYHSDISEIIFTVGGRGFGPIYRIICKDGSQYILTHYLSCFGVISEFFGKHIPITYTETNLFKHSKWIKKEANNSLFQ